MSQDSGGEKNLPASAQKRMRAREDGNIAKSQDLTSAIALFGALFALMYIGPYTMEWLREATRYFISHAHLLIPARTALSVLGFQVLYWLALCVLPFMGIMVLLGLASTYAQVGVLFTTKPLQPKFTQLNPFTGFQKFVSLRALVELIKSLSKLAVVTLVVWMFLHNKTAEFVALMAVPPIAQPAAIGALIYGVWWRIALAMLIIGLFDYAYQFWQRERDLRMTAQEAKQESKELEGDPQVKRRIRQLQRQMAQQRMIQDVPKADVIITNPTTYAVALRYDMATMSAPVVTAKGMRIIAERIRNIAIEHNVPIVQRPELARALYRTLEPGQPISEDLFRAVAEVLAFVYQIDQRKEGDTSRKVAV